jgi:hypothetical protein
VLVYLDDTIEKGNADRLPQVVSDPARRAAGGWPPHRMVMR